ncbi:MAG: DUF302 domain-containing protein [Campylobacterales bacterium]|jgi:uncharacterized protein (DUF302 family)
MLKKLLLAVMGIAITMSMSGCTKLSQYNKLDDGAMSAYMDMFGNVLEYGDPAKAMMKEYKVADDVENEDVAESIKALTEERNMRVTGDIKMFTKEDAKPDEVKHARIFSVCSLRIAKIFLNHSRYFGGFMPCRIMLVEYGNGERYLITMDLTLAIHGGYTLPPEMLKEAQFVQKAMEEIPSKAANGDF